MVLITDFVGSPTIILTLFENTDFTSQVFSETKSTDEMFADYGVPFWSGAPYFVDHDGSLKVTFNGPGSAELHLITVANFSGSISPSNVAFGSITPVASPVPWPAASLLFAPGLMLVSMAARRKI